jgi:SAM-dependent methyltransferase
MSHDGLWQPAQLSLVNHVNRRITIDISQAGSATHTAQPLRLHLDYLPIVCTPSIYESSKICNINPMKEAEFDQFADEYESQHRQNIAVTGESPEFFAEYKIRQLTTFVPDLLAAPARVLDFGSGIGNSIPFFRKYFPNASLTCADASSRSIELSRKRFPGQERFALVKGDEIPIDTGSFDLVFSACVFHHIAQEEHRHWLAELLRVTRPGGWLVIFEHNPFNPMTVSAVNTCPFDENAKLISASTLIRSINDAGWVRSELCYHVFFPRALAALRPIEKHLGWFALGAQYSARARKP